MLGTAVGRADRVGRLVAPGTVGRCDGRADVGRVVVGRFVGWRVLGRGVGPRDGEPAVTVGAGVALVGRTVGLRDAGLAVGLLVVASDVVADDDVVDDDGDLDAAVLVVRCVGWLLPKNDVG